MITNIRLSLTGVAILFCLATLTAGAQSLAVVLESQGDWIVINRGSVDGVSAGQTWVLGEKTGAVIIQEVREHSASGRLLGETHVGAIATLGTEQDARSFVKQQETQQQVAVQQTQRDLQTLRESYKQAIRQRTERRGFVTPVPGAGFPTGQVLSLGVEAYNIYQINQLTDDIGLGIGGGGGLYSPWWLAASAAQTYSQHRQRKKQIERRRVRVDAEVLLWDQKLVDLQTDVWGAEQGMTASQVESQRPQIRAQRGVNQYTIFEVSLRNVGQLPAPIQSFKEKMYLFSNEGRRISPTHVDEVLNRTLQPGEQVRGMAYFPKIVAAGQNRLRVSFENMFGDRGELKFKVPTN